MMSKEEILRSIDTFRRVSILVVGDLFLDEYVETTMIEVSREGPFPVLRHESVVQSAGAAGNLASSIRGLGAKVTLVAVVGRDERGRVVVEQLREKGIGTSGVIRDPGMPTLTYTKIRSRVENSPSQELFRVDVLPRGLIEAAIESRLLSAVDRSLPRVQGTILLDQVHHLVAGRLLRETPRMARRRKVFVQGSSRENIADFRGFDLVTPNDREATEALGGRSRPVRELGAELRKLGRHRQLLLTLGADGMAAFSHDASMQRLPSYGKKVVDVTGAGDAVSSVTILGSVLGWDLPTTAWVASQAAAVAIAHVGTHHIGVDELREAIRSAPGLA